MILGKNCTRNCKFCAVTTKKPEPVDLQEPKNIAEVVRRLGLKHTVITSVTRDDLSDGGSQQFKRVITELRKLRNPPVIETLIPDFQGDENIIIDLIAEKPDIFNHNLETVPELYEDVRPEADYHRSLKVLELVKTTESNIYTKSGLMLGLGENQEQLLKVMKDLRKVKCDILTLGQYLAPSNEHYPIKEYVSPNKYKELEQYAYDLGFKYVFAGPFVRSSFHASDFSQKLRSKLISENGSSY